MTSIVTFDARPISARRQNGQRQPSRTVSASSENGQRQPRRTVSASCENDQPLFVA
jgi:hypothetical protein